MWPVRACWTWLLATGVVTAGELLARNAAFDPVAWLGALASGCAMGSWIAVLTVLGSVLARRRGWQWPARLRPSATQHALIAAACVWSYALVGAGWIALDIGLGVVRDNPLDYMQTGAQLGRALLVFGIPIAVVVVVLATPPLVRWLAEGRRARVTIAAVGGIGVLLVAKHLGSGAFIVYFGAPAVLGLLALAAMIAALALPATRGGSRGAVACIGALLVAILGVAMLSHGGARALLLHHGRLTPTLVAFGVGFLDGDGDGDLPPWLGGGDCDDGDPAIGVAMPELPGNGIDDNCWAGDRAAAVESPPPPPASGPRPLLVLVTIDTVRPDRLELYGASRPTMPALAALGDTGLVFDRAYAPANHTFFAMTALLSGQSTERMLVPPAADAASVLPGMRYTRWLPQRLRELGYHVVAIAPPLVTDGKIAPQELYVDELELGPFDGGEKNRGTTARQIADAAIDRLENAAKDRPLALWIHFMDPHAVHESPVRFPVVDVTDAYDNELSWVDLHLSRVLAAARARAGDDALFVVTADHGESFGEDGDWGHGFSLAEREIRIPLVIAGAGVPRARRAQPVSTVAIAPTILALLGQPADPGHELPSLTSELVPPVLAANPAWLWNQLRMEVAWIAGDDKLVWSRTTNTIQRFDLATDPHERHALPVDAVAFDALRDALERAR